MPDETKFCKDCKWCSDPNSDIAKCTHSLSRDPTNNKYLVTGVMEHFYCQTMRGAFSDATCGPAGKLWEARKLEAVKS